MSPMVSSEQVERHLRLPGTYNFRDVGGYPAGPGRSTRRRMLYRSDALHRIDEAGRRQLQELGVRTILDLRSDEEVGRAPNSTGALEARTARHPIFADRELTNQVERPRPSLQDLYLAVVEQRSEALVGAVRELARPDVLPAVVHCTIGKDRTGMVVSVVLSFLGVDDEVVAGDYAATARHIAGEFHDELVAEHARRGFSVERVKALLAVDPTVILSFLEHVRRRYGSVVNYLSQHGMTDEEMNGLRGRLTVESSAT